MRQDTRPRQRPAPRIASHCSLWGTEVPSLARHPTSCRRKGPGVIRREARRGSRAGSVVVGGSAERVTDHEEPSGVAARALSTRSLRLEAEGDFDVADLRELEREVLQVGEMIDNMEMKVNVPRWTVQARQAAGAELLSTVNAGPSSVVSVEERGGGCDPRKALAAILFGAVLLAAVALAVCVAKLS
ncbi:PREDICTED: regulator of G-protein signaling 9-binding protein [Colobus angolensis palliatus]|uniref:regulator of G-protein signaling 9-binding protein n=1 Tax=Colobus angolensis palliatus TaxID=336983 RepID=UPI0005F461F0|nr:PREDICTED: regulator of G-protein signaling 9-binding protein [Colobus angolensis palliatus]